MTVFDHTQFARVNAHPVGPHAAEELLVVAPDAVRVRPGGWNDIPWRGLSLRVLDAAGNPVYPPVAFTAADMAGVRVLDDADEPHVVDAGST